MTKTVYQMDRLGLFVESVEVRESPLEPGAYLIPAGCVEIEPPAPAERQVPVWFNGAWKLFADHRGEIWFIGHEPVTIDFVGDPAERGYTSARPLPSFYELRSAKISAIEATSTTLLTAGAPVASGLHIALNDGSRADLTAMAATATAASAGAIPWPESYARGWITIENVRIALATPADGLALAAAVGNYYAAIVQHRRDLKDAILAAADEGALAAIDIIAGWPGS